MLYTLKSHSGWIWREQKFSSVFQTNRAAYLSRNKINYIYKNPQLNDFIFSYLLGNGWVTSRSWLVWQVWHNSNVYFIACQTEIIHLDRGRQPCHRAEVRWADQCDTFSRIKERRLRMSSVGLGGWLSIRRMLSIQSPGQDPSRIP